MSIFDGDLSVALSRITKSFGSSSNDIASLTPNARPFVSQHKYPDLVDVVDCIISTRDCVRSSSCLGTALKDIIDECVVVRLECCWSMQSVKSRLDAIMKLAIPFLVTPHLSSLLGGESGLAGDSPASFLTRTRTLIVDLFTFFIDAELSVYATGGDVALDKDRALLFSSLLLFKCTSFSLLPVVVAEYSPVGLQCLCQHLLGVTALCEDVMVAIDTLCKKLVMVILEGNNDTASDKNEVSRNEVSRSNSSRSQEHIHLKLKSLLPHVRDFFAWLRQIRNPLVKMCRIVEVVECVHPSLRSSLHNENYTSSHDIVAKYLSKYKPHLTLLPLPLQPFRRNDVKQAIRDISRETFILNGEPVAGDNLLEQTFHCIRTHFISDSLPDDGNNATDTEDAIATTTGGNSGNGSGVLSQESLTEHQIEHQQQQDQYGDSGGGTVCQGGRVDDSVREEYPTMERERSISNNSIGEGSFFRPTALANLIEELRQQETPPLPQAHPTEDHDNTQKVLSNAEEAGAHINRAYSGTPPLEKRVLGANRSYRQTGVDFMELLLRFLLIALSRTFSSGDAFFVIEDLFGGEGLCLCGPNNHTQKTLMKVTKMKISSEAIIVEVCQHYHLYQSDAIGSDEESIHPLISFEAKIYTLLTFKDILLSKSPKLIPSGIGSTILASTSSTSSTAIAASRGGCESSFSSSSLNSDSRVAQNLDSRTSTETSKTSSPNSQKRSVRKSSVIPLQDAPSSSHSHQHLHKTHLEEVSPEKEVREGDGRNGTSGRQQSTTSPPTPSQLSEMFVLLTSCPDKICHRSLTITPYILSSLQELAVGSSNMTASSPARKKKSSSSLSGRKK